MKVSIVIPVYNEALYLPACLDAIAAQTVRPYEVIVVDNNSSDGTAQIAEQYDFVRLLREPRRGIAHARNRGFDAARGQIIGRIDADTVLSPTWTADVTEAFKTHAGSVAITGSCTFYDAPYLSAMPWLHCLVYYRLQAMVAGTEVLWGSNMALTRDAWRQVHADCSLRGDVPEDIDLSLVLARQGKKIARLAQLRAAVSLRRGKLSVRDVAAYLRWWPRVYWRHGRYFAAGCIWLVYAAVCLAAAIAQPLLVVTRVTALVLGDRAAVTP